MTLIWRMVRALCADDGEERHWLAVVDYLVAETRVSLPRTPSVLRIGVRDRLGPAGVGPRSRLPRKRPCYQHLEEVARRSHIVTVPFVFVRACPKTPKELAAEAWASRNVGQVIQLPLRVFGPRAYEAARRQRLLAWFG